MYDSVNLKKKLYRKGWRQFWGKGHDKWICKRVIKSVPFSRLWLYAVSWRMALMIEYGRMGGKK